MLLYAPPLQHCSLWCSLHCCPSLKILLLILIQQVIMHFSNLTELEKKVFQCLSQTSELCLTQNGGLIVAMISSTEHDSWKHQNTTSLIFWSKNLLSKQFVFHAVFHTLELHYMHCQGGAFPFFFSFPLLLDGAILKILADECDFNNAIPQFMKCTNMVMEKFVFHNCKCKR